MKRQKRFKRVRMPPFLEELKAKILKRLTSLFVIFLFFMVSLLLLKAFLYRSDYFRMKAIEIKDISKGQGLSSPHGDELLSAYHGKNIFEVNIAGIARSLETSYPDAKTIVARRVLPDKIVIDLKFRKAVAMIANMKYYPVDEEGVVFSNVVGLESSNALPIIVGLDVRNEGRRDKRVVQHRNLKVVLDLLREMNRSRFSMDYNVIKIDVGDIADTAFHLKEGPTIRIGYENFKERLNMLRKTLKDPRLVMDRIEYIDLRFRDVVVGPKLRIK